MKTLVLTTTYPKFTSWDATPGFVHELTKRLVQQWLKAIVLTPRRPGTKSYEEQDGVKIYRYSYFFISSREKLADGAILPNIKKNKFLVFQIPFLLLWCLIALVRLCKTHHITTIHAHRIFPSGFLAALYKKYINPKMRVICTSHGSDLHSLSGWIIDAIKKRTVKQCDIVTVVSNYLKNNLDQLMWQKTDAKVISMWVDETKFHPDNYDENLKTQYWITGKFLLFVGRLAPEKWVEDLIRAMPEVVKQMPEIKLLIVWHWPLEHDLKKITSELWLNRNITFVWAIPNNELPKYYATADVLIAPSKKESFGLVQVEAIMSGTPVITTAWLGSTDIIQEGINGYFVFSIKEITLNIYTLLQENKKQDNKTIRQSVASKFSRGSVTQFYSKLF